MAHEFRLHSMDQSTVNLNFPGKKVWCYTCDAVEVSSEMNNGDFFMLTGQILDHDELQNKLELQDKTMSVIIAVCHNCLFELSPIYQQQYR